MKILINNNVFDVLNRIKRINKNFYVVFNTVSKKFELHSCEYGRNSYVLTFPYDSLDVRAVNYVLKTFNSKPISLDEVELYNENVKKKQLEKVQNENDYKTRKMYDYYNKKSNSIDKIFKNIWI